jgi:hypothetical protein
MKSNSTTTPTAVDRLATPEEILAADFLDPVQECTLETFHEIANESGGYTRIPAVDFEIASMVEELMRLEDAKFR